MAAKTERRELKIQNIEVERLHLDPENPRLSDIGAKGTEDEILKTLWDEMAVSEVALSIAANGYFEEEPLFVIPKSPKTTSTELQHYTVVEGNRRLAAVKLLCDPQLRRLVKATELDNVSSKIRESLATLPVSIYPDKKSLWEYFGFRHVNGPKEWDSFSKAAYIAEVQRKYGISLDEIARKIGDQHSTVARIYRGYILLEQAEQMTSFRREDRIANRFHFSHLYTAADQKEFQTYLGIDPERSLKESPVSRANLPKLGELMVWLFGSKRDGKSPVVEKQNPHLKYLRTVLGSRQALYALRSGINLQRAYEISLGDDRRFEEALVRAKDAMQEAKATVTTGYKGEKDMLKVMDGILDLAKSISNEMHQKTKS